jgi:4,5-dihydroxyphthalate decarboxylase
MAKNLRLTLACDDYEFVRPLWDGTVTPEGLQLLPQPGLSIAERQLRMVHDLAFDLCELSVTTYALARERGLPLTALPIFLLRRFRHGDIFINTNSGIRTPKDLVGKRIGGISYQVASNVWARGILSEQYGVPHDSVTWVVERDEEIRFDIPPELRIETLRKEMKSEAALLLGKIDAVILPVVPPSILDGDSRVARLLPEFRSIEAKYFRETRIFPIMHVLAVKRAVIDEHPWIAGRLLHAFTTAKESAYIRMRGMRAVPLAWFSADWEQERRVLGPDPWVYGLDDVNKHNLDTVIRYMHEQSLLKGRLKIDQLFVSH